MLLIHGDSLSIGVVRRRRRGAVGGRTNGPRASDLSQGSRGHEAILAAGCGGNSHDCGMRVNPKIVEGQVMGATAHAIGAAMFEVFAYDDEGNLLTPNFYDYHVPHTLDMPPLKTAAIESPSPFTPLGTKGMGEGGGGGIHCIGAALQDALRASGGAIVTSSHNPYHRVWEMLRDPERSRSKVEVSSK